MSKKALVKSNVVLDTLEVVYLPIESIKPNTYNPNRQSQHDFELLCKSIAADGFTQPIVVLKSTLEIVDGEHRWRACKALGHDEIPVGLVDMTPEQMRIATLRHNRARGSEDASLAANVLKDLARLGAIEYAQDELQLDQAEVARLLGDMPEDEIENLTMDIGADKLGTRGVGLSEFDQSHAIDTTADERRAKESLLARAKLREEQDMSVRDKTYRLILVFTGDEAEIVKRVLGESSKNHGEAILSLCRGLQHPQS